MTHTLSIPGLPRSLAQDGWWLDAPAADRPDLPAPPQAAPRRLPRRAGLAALVGLADLLFWHHAPGLSLALFAGAILAVAAVATRRSLWRPALLLLVAAAPVVEHLQPLSIAFLTLGLAAALVWLRRPEATAAELAALAPALLRRWPGQGLAPLAPRQWRPIGQRWATRSNRPGRRMLRDWAFPAAGGLVLTALLLQANPVLARVLDLDLDLWAALWRGLFWGGAALALAPLLSPDLPEPLAFAGAVALPARRLGLNPASVLRALVVFNALIALQTGTDLSILVFGAALPEGMSLAEYAHRGAYPLLATALLAGAFALAARPFLHEHRAIRPLLLLWLAQNMVLCGAAMLRLEHYIDAFGLTYLRLDALIWMGLVAAGLGLVAVQLLRGRTNLWLLARGSLLGMATLYACAFVNFAQIIAAQNLTRANPDTAYICALGPMAHGAVTDRPEVIGRAAQVYPCPLLQAPAIAGWREWGFRSARVARYSAAMETPERTE